MGSTVPSNSGAPASMPPPRRGSPLGRFFAGLAVVIVVAAVAVGLYVLNLVHRVPIVGTVIGSYAHNTTVADEFPGVNAMNLMVIGRDYDYTDRDQIIKSHARSD